ncbi:MAG: hypothetical protein JWR61_211 [Ferruginibacter sp.]|uniref:LamG domain-containing protein n=1 Tax=Ferruginibacter sp. TaxID=1940288 RepID=UPI00265B554A|nr:LamG domain-containing protein [Ferruginibacter sp.]MDB5275256.1 hypothetical protein [Ferruginibacter sp.]
MNIRKIMTKNVVLIIAFGSLLAGCQKITHPALGDYTKDANPVGGPLKFYAAFDGTSDNPLMNGVDSIRANFPSSNTAAVGEGISGKGYKGSETAFAQYASANDFTSATSFTISFWVKKTPQAAGKGTNFAFALNSSGYSWTNLKMFLEFEDAGNPSTTDSAAAKFYLFDQWFEFTGVKRMKNVLNGQWHHLAFTYDATTSVLTPYIDGAVPTNLPAGFGNVINNGAPMGPLNFNSGKAVTGLTIGGAGEEAYKANSWMGYFDGQLDQFRLYGTALSAADIAALYSNKQ